jgi:hypothetical protein
MSSTKLTAEQQLDEVMEVCMQDLLALSSSEMAAEGGSKHNDVSSFDAIFARASEEAGQSRLAAAKVALVKRKSAALPVGIDVAMAKRMIEQAANDPRITLAARGLGDLSEEEIVRIYWQIETLRKDDDGESS